GACWSCQDICKEGYFADVLECERVCAEQGKKCGGDEFGALDPSAATGLQVSCWACVEKEPEPSVWDIFWEILDIDAGWTKVSTLPAEHRVHLIVASNGDPDIRTFLPIKVELVVDGDVVWQTTIRGSPQETCRDATGCSIDGPLIQSSWQGKEVTLKAYSKEGKVLASSQFDIKVPKIKVIEYQGKYIPLTSLRVAAPNACGKEHWHPIYDAITSTDNTILFDPNPEGCGFGALDTTPVISVAP
ncbi:hypothetical protein MYX07_00190, partial [Patescibacteria group bacterium AH-259-L07]|nr:hypothetical protein [Patescibacteria group bacterium AH-259-L07]